MLTKTTRSAINLGVPTAAAGVTAFIMLKSGKDWKYMLIATVIVFVGLYVLVTQLTKIAAENAPAQVPTGGGCDSYDPTGLVDALHQDINCVFCTRDRELYTTLLGLSDCQTIKVYNDWNKRYYADDKETLPVAIMRESGINAAYRQQQNDLRQKFSTLNLQ